MKLKKWLERVDPIVDVMIWTEDNENDDEPDYEGSLLDIPWYYMDYELPPKYLNKDEPIYITTKTNSHGVTLPVISINVVTS